MTLDMGNVLKKERGNECSLLVLNRDEGIYYIGVI